MISSFKLYLEEQSSVGYLVFGRFNPPTTGHEKLLNKVSSLAKGNDYKIFASQSVDSKKNPLEYRTKVKFMRKMFPKHGRNIILDTSVKNFLDATVYMYKQGYKNLVMVAGSDRVAEFDKLLQKYNGVESRHGLYKFDTVKVVSAGDRDPDSDDVSGMSASKQRENAKNNDFAKFSQGLPKGVSDSLAKQLFNAVRKGMNLNENKSFIRHVELETVSERREDYVNGELFYNGQSVILKETDEVVTITHCGSNYIIVEMDGKKKRKWLTDVEPLEERKTPEDPDIGDAPGSQPKKYYTGMAKSTKKARAAQFKRQAKMSDDDPAAYKPAPGDTDAKTKPSKYTKKFKQMYGEENLEEEKIEGLVKKAEKSGISYGILKQVYNRGMAAWKTGHRPGTTPQQWAFARVNSFITGGKTRKTTDSDLWAKVKK